MNVPAKPRRWAIPVFGGGLVEFDHPPTAEEIRAVQAKYNRTAVAGPLTEEESMSPEADAPVTVEGGAG